jgi:hypothetical protein
MDKKALVELLKSTGRYIWFGLLGVVVAALTALLAAPEVVEATVTVGDFKVSVGFIIVAVIGSIIKAVDTYIHNNKKIESNGLAPEFLQK